ncbi:gasdermin-A2-like [Phaenicophaeus curvirostris]|uniref:gasdermin-A2-like n=1 Tax=Phaenicophaeus curvirostris TaxID=33595 RepID=UPI0037F0DF3E
MFKTLTQAIAKQMDPRGDLVPVQSILDHEHFRPLCLVIRKNKTIFHPSPSYKRTWYKLDDVLLHGDNNRSTVSLLPNDGDQNLRQFTFNESSTDRVDGSLSIRIDSTSAQLTGAASCSKVLSIKLEKKDISVAKLEALRAERKINRNHSFIQQLNRTRQNLYVVHETIEASEETHYEESTEGKGSFMAQLYVKFFAKGTRENKQSITIPKGCTLAFRAIRLSREDDSWGFNYFPDDKILLLASDGSFQEKLEGVEKEVKDNCQILSHLSSNLLLVFLKAIKAVMRDRNLFQELTQKMEAILDETSSCELKTESPDLKDLLSSLENSPRHLLLQLAGAITYTLDALDELKEDQLLLLLESLEEGIVSRQLKLVENILAHDIKCKKSPFRVDASLLSFAREKEQKLTVTMVAMSGVKLQADGFTVCAEEAFSSMAALYASLYVLNVLTNSD